MSISNKTIRIEFSEAFFPVISPDSGHTTVIFIDIPTLFAVCIIATLLLYLGNRIASKVLGRSMITILNQELDLEGGVSETTDQNEDEEILDSLILQQERRQARRHEALEKLIPKVRYGSRDLTSSSSDCTICLEGFENGESCRVFPVCNHIFHSYCIDHWLKKKFTCPLCRASLLHTEQGRIMFFSLL